MWFLSPISGTAVADGDLTATRLDDGRWEVRRGPRIIEIVPELVGLRLRVHEPDMCSGPRCTIHNPSPGPMRDWPRSWRGDRYLMERICPHGIGHPDPDHITYIEREYGPERAGIDAVHGCDGCCASCEVEAEVFPWAK